MIDRSLRHKIRGLDELFKLLSEDYNFHDAGLESVNWDASKEELTVVYLCCYTSAASECEHIYHVSFHLKPEMNDFEIFMSPHNPYTYGIDITRSDSFLSKYRFEADGAGPILNCQDIWIEIKED